jgi:hypothetical protein
MDIHILLSYAAVCVYLRFLIGKHGESARESFSTVSVAVFGLEFIRVYINVSILQKIGI